MIQFRNILVRGSQRMGSLKNPFCIFLLKNKKRTCVVLTNSPDTWCVDLSLWVFPHRGRTAAEPPRKGPASRCRRPTVGPTPKTTCSRIYISIEPTKDSQWVKVPEAPPPKDSNALLTNSLRCTRWPHARRSSSLHVARERGATVGPLDRRPDRAIPHGRTGSPAKQVENPFFLRGNA